MTVELLLHGDPLTLKFGLELYREVVLDGVVVPIVLPHVHVAGVLVAGGPVWKSILWLQSFRVGLISKLDIKSQEQIKISKLLCNLQRETLRIRRPLRGVRGRRACSPPPSSSPSLSPFPCRTFCDLFSRNSRYLFPEIFALWRCLRKT